jgi:2-polyprenyl-3-methyl-5-hydroxy-6-metoxy-1,4-benzoquinol methylase
MIKTASADLQWNSISSFLQFWLGTSVLARPEQDTFDVYYTSYRKQFSAYNQFHYTEQTREITAAIQTSVAPRLLEIGAGCGTESLWFGLMGARVTAIDLATDRLSTARARQQCLEKMLGVAMNVNFKEAALFDYDPPQKFDMIWMEQTFHHLEPRKDVYPKLFQLLKPGGTLFVCDLNAWNPAVQLQLFMQRGFKTKTFFTDESGRRIAYGNERVTTPHALRHGLKKAGFHIQSTRMYRILPNSNPPAIWMKAERAILGVLPFLSSHFNIAAYKPLA